METNTATQTQVSKGKITIPEPLEEVSILLIQIEEGIMVKREESGRSEINSLRGAVKEIEVEKASKFIRELRSKWKAK